MPIISETGLVARFLPADTARCGEIRRTRWLRFNLRFLKLTPPTTQSFDRMPDSQSSSPTGKSGDSGYIPGDDSWTQWRNIFAILSGKMTDEGKEQFRVARDIRNEAADCKRCEDQRDYLLQYSEFAF